MEIRPKFSARDTSAPQRKPMHDGTKTPRFAPAEMLGSRRESDPPEDDANACQHKNARGSKYQSKFCPVCGEQLLFEPTPAEERFRDTKRRSIENNYRACGPVK